MEIEDSYTPNDVEKNERSRLVVYRNEVFEQCQLWNEQYNGFSVEVKDLLKTRLDPLTMALLDKINQFSEQLDDVNCPLREINTISGEISDLVERIGDLMNEQSANIDDGVVVLAEPVENEAVTTAEGGDDLVVVSVKTARNRLTEENPVDIYFDEQTLSQIEGNDLLLKELTAKTANITMEAKVDKNRPDLYIKLNLLKSAFSRFATLEGDLLAVISGKKILPQSTFTLLLKRYTAQLNKLIEQSNSYIKAVSEQSQNPILLEPDGGTTVSEERQVFEANRHDSGQPVPIDLVDQVSVDSPEEIATILPNGNLSFNNSLAETTEKVEAIHSQVRSRYEEVHDLQKIVYKTIPKDKEGEYKQADLLRAWERIKSTKSGLETKRSELIANIENTSEENITAVFETYIHENEAIIAKLNELSGSLEKFISDENDLSEIVDPSLGKEVTALKTAPILLTNEMRVKEREASLDGIKLHEDYNRIRFQYQDVCREMIRVKNLPPLSQEYQTVVKKFQEVKREYDKIFTSVTKVANWQSYHDRHNSEVVPLLKKLEPIDQHVNFDGVRFGKLSHLLTLGQKFRHDSIRMMSPDTDASSFSEKTKHLEQSENDYRREVITLSLLYPNDPELQKIIASFSNVNDYLDGKKRIVNRAPSLDQIRKKSNFFTNWRRLTPTFSSRRKKAIEVSPIKTLTGEEIKNFKQNIVETSTEGVWDYDLYNVQSTVERLFRDYTVDEITRLATAHPYTAPEQVKDITAVHRLDLRAFFNIYQLVAKARADKKISLADNDKKLETIIPMLATIVPSRSADPVNSQTTT